MSFWRSIWDVPLETLFVVGESLALIEVYVFLIVWKVRKAADPA